MYNNKLHQNSKPVISLVGIGNIGALLLAKLSEDGKYDIILYDIMTDLCKARGLDATHMNVFGKYNSSIKVASSISGISDSDVIIITAGITRKSESSENWSRRDLLYDNGKVITKIGSEIGKYAPNAFVIIVTNPVDVMCTLFLKASCMPPNMVVGCAGFTDTNRFRNLLAQKLNLNHDSVQALVVGCHDETMIPLSSHISICGVPLNEYKNFMNISDDEMNEIIDDVINMAIKIVKLSPMGSSYLLPAYGALKMAEAFLHDSHSVIPCSAFCNGVYDVYNMHIGVPAIISKRGVFKVLEISFSDKEKELWKASVDSLINIHKLWESQI